MPPNKSANQAASCRRPKGVYPPGPPDRPQFREVSDGAGGAGDMPQCPGNHYKTWTDLGTGPLQGRAPGMP